MVYEKWKVYVCFNFNVINVDDILNFKTISSMIFIYVGDILHFKKISLLDLNNP